VLGPLLENFVLGELARQLGWAATRATLRHDRTRDGVEVDAILEAADGRIVGIEVTSAETVRGDDFSGVRHLQARVPERFLHGLVLYAGSKTLPFGDRLLGAPIDALWCAEDKPSSPWHSVRVIAPRASRRLRRAPRWSARHGNEANADASRLGLRPTGSVVEARAGPFEPRLGARHLLER